jgi:myo-inositol-1(or 4)-monophosphatase
MADSKFLTVAKEAAIEAGKIVKKYYQSKLELHGKGHVANFATKADLESEAKVIEIIKANFPEHNIIGEESGRVDNGSEYTWAIDPIDGTIPFVDGIPFLVFR